MIQLFHSFNKGSPCTSRGYQKALPFPSPSKNGKNNRKAGPQETGGYDIRLGRGFQAYLSHAAGATITGLRLRCGTARPTL